MATYVVMEPPGRSEKVDATAFIRDGFTWLGLLVPPLWLAWHRLWIEAGLAFAVMSRRASFCSGSARPSSTPSPATSGWPKC